MLSLKSRTMKKIHITYTENEYETFTITEDSTVSIKHTRNYRWYDYIIMININQPKITVALPDNYAGDVSVLNNNGEIYIGSINALGNYYCNTHNGKISISNLDSQSIDFKTNNGDIVGDITGSFQDYKIDGKTKNGHSNLPSETFAGNRRLKAETNNGDIEIRFLG